MLANDQERTFRYILITPVKDEEKNLPRVARSLINQTVRPVLWYIIDDGSTDRTNDVISHLRAENDWIQSVKLPPHSRDITFHLSAITQDGFEQAIGYCSMNGIQFDYIGLVDGDTVPEEAFFEKLKKEFDVNLHLGIASGHITDMTEGEIEWDKIKDVPDKLLPRGSGRLWRKECFLATGGYLIEPSPDSISHVKAELRGWDTRQFGHIRAVQLRETSSAQGLWRGYQIRGNTAYYFGKPPLLIFLGTLSSSLQRPHYIGLAYLIGYLKAMVKKTPHIKDTEITSYYQKKGLWRHLRSL